MLTRIVTFAAGVAIIGTLAPNMLSQKPTAAKSVVAEAPADAPAGYKKVIAVSADAFGHYSVEAVINGHSVPMLIDTGATYVALSEATARRLGIRLDPGRFVVRIGTANGVVGAAPVTLSEVTVGPIHVRNVEAVVVGGGGFDIDLLGMSFLNKLKYTAGGEQLVLAQ
ncbi:MAG TPA: TIGR02281 family clan AA aspartic protease [Bauldia sp.]|nr:TIGR02281 family clan AA aspartic protease [Bauldia sp.]